MIILSFRKLESQEMKDRLYKEKKIFACWKSCLIYNKLNLKDTGNHKKWAEYSFNFEDNYIILNKITFIFVPINLMLKIGNFSMSEQPNNKGSLKNRQIGLLDIHYLVLDNININKKNWRYQVVNLIPPLQHNKNEKTNISPQNTTL